MNSKGVFEEASVCQSDIPSRKRGACYEFQCISSSELFAKKIRSKRKWSVSPLRYDWKRASGAPKYHHFQTLTTKKAKNSSQRRHTVTVVTFSPLPIIFCTLRCHSQFCQWLCLFAIPGWLSFLGVSYMGKSKSYRELTLPSSRGIERHWLAVETLITWSFPKMIL